jgi:hypothetical protein
VRIECDRCGEFILTAQLKRELGRLSDERRALVPFLSADTRQANSQGIVRRLETGNWEDFARPHSTTAVPQKLMRLLDLLAKKGQPGQVVQFHPDVEAPLVDAPDAWQVRYLINALEKRGDLERAVTRQPGVVPSPGSPKDGYRLTVDGWTRLNPGPGGVPGHCFVAMWFDPQMDPVYEDGIYPAIKVDCQMEPDRVDRSPSNDRIDDRVIAAIRAAEFTIADVTGHRPNVYFEAGFAMALGRPVIWTAKQGEPALHFDVRQFPLLEWRTPEDLREKLRYRVLATIPSAQQRG